eukprot:CAMPEP_0114251544 /NCGR_PEP_ID=MMETSP0058-20121206/15328_1 /TAXON_ID=36894 /ORGANISM="Pyramimonas parkeae, CCMP726" /LENGTH=95 /DNA_ID=CAMNT_0001365355 /DNA_START=501 /DNA_END=788 /DNA_ORIENTATION=+
MAAAPAARSGTPCTPNAATDDPPERAAAHTCPTPPIVDAEARWLIDFEAHFTNASAAWLASAVGMDALAPMLSWLSQRPCHAAPGEPSLPTPDLI